MAISHSVFLCFILLRLSKKQSNLILTFILFFLSIRIGTCVLGLIYTDLEFFSAYIGAISMLTLGPLIYLYQNSLWEATFKFKTSYYYHFIPSVLALCLFYIVETEVAAVFYITSILLMCLYLIFGIKKFSSRTSSTQPRSNKIKWGWYFNFGISVLTGIFIIQLFLFDPYTYLMMVVVSALISYALSIWSVKYVKLFIPESSKKEGSRKQLMKLGEKIELALVRDILYLDPELTVSKLAHHLHNPPYLISLAINYHYNKSFPEIINELRIKRAQQLLIDHQKQHYTIEAIAYECGFNTLSAFYSCFKKITLKTPLQYRKQFRNKKGT